PDAQQHRAATLELVLETGKELGERALATGQQGVDVSRLRCPGAGGRLRRQRVALEDNDVLEVRRDRTRGGGPAHARRGGGRPPQGRRGCRPLVPGWCWEWLGASRRCPRVYEACCARASASIRSRTSHPPPVKRMSPDGMPSRCDSVTILPSPPPLLFTPA